MDDCTFARRRGSTSRTARWPSGRPQKRPRGGKAAPVRTIYTLSDTYIRSASTLDGTHAGEARASRRPAAKHGPSAGAYSHQGAARAPDPRLQNPD